MPAQNEESNRLLTVADVANWLNISGSLVYQLVESGKIPVIRIGNGRGAIRFESRDIAVYIESCRLEKTGQAAPPVVPRLKHIKLK